MFFSWLYNIQKKKISKLGQAQQTQQYITEHFNDSFPLWFMTIHLLSTPLWLLIKIMQPFKHTHLSLKFYHFFLWHQAEILKPFKQEGSVLKNTSDGQFLSRTLKMTLKNQMGSNPRHSRMSHSNLTRQTKRHAFLSRVLENIVVEFWIFLKKEL